MPVVAVGLAVALDVGAIGAAMAGTLTTLSAITAIGATMSAVGAVTHNKTLSYIGMGVGIVGAIGTMASGAGLFDNVTDLFGSSSAAGSADLASFAEQGADAATEAVNAGTTGLIDSTSANILSQTGDLNLAALTPTGVPTTAGLESSVTVKPVGFPDAAASSKPTITSDMASVTAEGPTGAYALERPPISPADMPGTPAAANGGMGGFDDPNWLSTFTNSNGSGAPGGILNWAKNNQLLSYGILQAGGSFISGLSNPMTPAQINALNSQADVNRATAELLQRQKANLGSSMPTAARSAQEVTGRVDQPGLVNNAPKQLITGQPAPYSTPIINSVTGTPA